MTHIFFSFANREVFVWNEERGRWISVTIFYSILGAEVVIFFVKKRD